MRAYNIDCGAGAGPCAVSYCGPLRACIACLQSNIGYIAFNFVIEIYIHVYGSFQNYGILSGSV